MNKVNISPSMLTQAYRAAEEIGNVLGRKVGIDQLAQIVELLDGKEVIKPEVQAVARNTRPTASKNIASKTHYGKFYCAISNVIIDNFCNFNTYW